MAFRCTKWLELESECRHCHCHHDIDDCLILPEPILHCNFDLFIIEKLWILSSENRDLDKRDHLILLTVNSIRYYEYAGAVFFSLSLSLSVVPLKLVFVFLVHCFLPCAWDCNEINYIAIFFKIHGRCNTCGQQLRVDIATELLILIKQYDDSFKNHSNKCILCIFEAVPLIEYNAHYHVMNVCVFDCFETLFCAFYVVFSSFAVAVKASLLCFFIVRLIVCL